MIKNSTPAKPSQAIGGPSHSAHTSPTTIGEVTIFLRPYDMSYCEYIGTRMQIEAEGIISAGVEWPEGYSDLRWESNGFQFWLRRRRPEGAKGPRRAFVDCDNWHLRVEKSGRDNYNCVIEQKTKELRQAIYDLTPEGKAAWHKRWRQYDAAQGDSRFQAFKALVPGLIPAERKRRGRPPKAAATQSQEV